MLHVLRCAEPGHGVAPRGQMTEHVQIFSPPAAVACGVDQEGAARQRKRTSQVQGHRETVQRHATCYLEKRQLPMGKTLHAPLREQCDDEPSYDALHDTVPCPCCLPSYAERRSNAWSSGHFLRLLPIYLHVLMPLQKRLSLSGRAFRVGRRPCPQSSPSAFAHDSFLAPRLFSSGSSATARRRGPSLSSRSCSRCRGAR